MCWNNENKALFLLYYIVVLDRSESEFLLLTFHTGGQEEGREVTQVSRETSGCAECSQVCRDYNRKEKRKKS